MKRIIFSSLLIAGLFVSLNSFAASSYGHCRWGGGGHAGYGYRGGYAVHTGFGFHAGFGYASPRVFYPPVPAPIVYGQAHLPAYGAYPYYYSHPRYIHAFYRRPFNRRW
jgi:hypothetical protein